MKNLIIHLCFVVSIHTIYTPLAEAQDQVSEDSAVIIMYHRFGENDFPSTNVKLEKFEQHIEELNKEKYNIVSLKTITEAFKNSLKLPPRTIAITIDDGYISSYTEAWPRLKKAGIPFTIFISTGSIDEQNKRYLTWENIRELDAEPLVDIGHHGHAHAHMTNITPSEALTDIAAADEIFERELGYIPNIFAFPYGEYSENLLKTIKVKNYHAALAQYSSVANSNSNLMALPRFSLNEKYSNIERFKLIVNSRALSVKDVKPRSPILEINPPAIGFTVDSNIDNLEALNCFPSHMNIPAGINRIEKNKIEVRFDKPFPSGRHRVNCTMPAFDGRWYWYGMPFFNLGSN